MQARNFPVTLTTLSKWEVGDRQPGKLAARALLRFLEEHPTIPRRSDP
jgi:DNA-binding transcriptional regulator YiaG